MKFLNLFWFFLDGDKSSSQITASKKQPVQTAHHESEETSKMVEEDSDEFFDEFLND